VRLAVVAFVVAVAASAAAAATPAVLHLDLKAQTLGGKPILGQTTGAIVAALGRPTSHTQGVLRARFTYGPRGRWSALVLFRRNRGTLRSWSVVLADRRLREATLGAPLRLSLRRLQSRLVTELGMRIVKPYRCGTTCRGDVAIPGSELRIGFGRIDRRPPYLVLYDAR
jgi:hypothetical protein